MGTDRGVIYVAYGQQAQEEAKGSVASLKALHDWPVLVISDAKRIQGADQMVRFGGDEGWNARRAKLHVNVLSPWAQFLYLDADTRVKGDLSAGFAILDDGWDLAITASGNQESQFLWQASEPERELTRLEVPLGLSLQGGLFYANRNKRTDVLFSAWREEWTRFATVDQGALIRALHLAPVKLWLLSDDYNRKGGHIVDHRFGRARG